MKKRNSVAGNMTNLLSTLQPNKKNISLTALLDAIYGPSGSKSRKQFETRLKKIAKGSELELAALQIAARNARDNKKAKNKKVNVKAKRYKKIAALPRAKARKEKEQLVQHFNDAGLE